MRNESFDRSTYDASGTSELLITQATWKNEDSGHAAPILPSIKLHLLTP